MRDDIVEEELALLETVLRALEELPEARSASHAPLVRELEHLQRVMNSGSEAKDASALQEQWHHQAAVLEQLRRAGPNEKVDPGSPYFAHLRLLEDGKTRDLCLGRATCLGRGVRIVDWRDAPISKIFYRYQQGEEFDEEISDRERIGEVLVRRMLRIDDGRLERIQAPEGDYSRDPADPQKWRRADIQRARLAGSKAVSLRAHEGGQAAERRLGSDTSGKVQRADKHLPEITGLIDPSQFDLITRPSSGFLVIRGSAGSGKTTVALHRVAYLAFHDPRIDSPDTLVVMFSRALRNYVEHVLPSLGLGRVGIVTYPEWVAKQRRRHFPRLPNAVREDSPAFVQRLKLHPVLGVALERQVERVHGRSSWEQALDDWSSVLTQAELLRETCAEIAPGAFADEEIERFVTANRICIEALHAFLAGEQDVDAALDAEDDAILLRAWQLRVGPLKGRNGKPLRYRHIVLDEVQDFSPLEVQVLLACQGPEPSITLAGDTQQHVTQNAGFTSWSEFFRFLGVLGAEVETLKISYRSSREIVQFAHALLRDLSEEEDGPIATRSGPPVEFFRFGGRGACIAFLIDALRELRRNEPLASVAVLTSSAEMSLEYFRGLERGEILGLRQVQDEDFSFAPGIEVTEIEQVKGLEFDYVIIVEVGAGTFRDSPAARRLLHVAATRAVHQLWLTAVGVVSPLIRDIVDGAESGAA